MTEAPRQDHSGEGHDHFVHLNVGWEAYQALLAWRGERAVPRLAYRDGVLELMSPSLDHERIASMLRRLTEAWAEESQVSLNSYGSWTLRDDGVQRGLEADGSYVVGTHRPERPDLAIEVAWSRGGLDKLPIYAALGVPELWYWRAGTLRVFVLDGGIYEEAGESQVLPGFPVQLVGELATAVDQTAAVRTFRQSIR